LDLWQNDKSLDLLITGQL